MQEKVILKFDQLTPDEKADFLVHCQELLVKYHPTSRFIIRQSTIEKLKKEKNETSHPFLDFMQKYRGFAYKTTNTAILFNKTRVNGIADHIDAVKRAIYQEPDPNYNALYIDFVAFRSFNDCAEFARSIIMQDKQIEYIAFVKNNEVKIYKLSSFFNRVNVRYFETNEKETSAQIQQPKT